MTQNTLPELIRQDIGEAKRAKERKKEYWWLCPFHQDSDASLQVDFYEGAKKWRWKCWGCGKDGDAQDWLVEKRNMTPEAAWRFLGGEPVSDDTESTQPHFHYGAEPPAQEWQDAALDACLEAAAANLAEGERYLAADNSELEELPDDSQKHVWRAARAYAWLRRRGLHQQTIERAMLGYNDKWRKLATGDWLAPGITIPAFTRDALWYVQVRLTAGEAKKQNKKYMALSGSRLAALYGAEQLLEARLAVVVEGEYDALLLSQFFASSEVAVVTMGSAGTLPAPRWKRFLAWADKVLVVMDDDDAGRAALEKWRQLIPYAELLPPPEAPGKDVTDWWHAGVDLREWLEPWLEAPAVVPVDIKPVGQASQPALVGVQ